MITLNEDQMVKNQEYVASLDPDHSIPVQFDAAYSSRPQANMEKAGQSVGTMVVSVGDLNLPVGLSTANKHCSKARYSWHQKQIHRFAS